MLSETGRWWPAPITILRLRLKLPVANTTRGAFGGCLVVAVAIVEQAVSTYESLTIGRLFSTNRMLEEQIERERESFACTQENENENERRNERKRKLKASQWVEAESTKQVIEAANCCSPLMRPPQQSH